MQNSGVITLQGRGTFDGTVRKLEELLKAAGVHLFCVIDHAGEALAAGMRMRPTRLLIFGDPKAGTPIMVASPEAALDLPLKILVAEDEAGRVWISYNSPEYLQARHLFPQELVRNIASVGVLAHAAADIAL